MPLPKELIAEGLSNGGKLTFTSQLSAVEVKVLMVVAEAFDNEGEVTVVQLFTTDGQHLTDIGDDSLIEGLLP